MYGDGEQIAVRLTGGGPYGLRLSGGGRRGESLVVAKMHKKSKARAAGVRVGDVVLSINGNRCHGMNQETAYDLIDYSFNLDLQLLRVSDDQIQLDGTSSFRLPQQPSSRSLSASPFRSGSESISVLQQSNTTELFRHKVSPRIKEPAQSSDRKRLDRLIELSDGEGQLTDEELKVKVTGDVQRKTDGIRWQPGLPTTTHIDSADFQTLGRSDAEKENWQSPKPRDTERRPELTERKKVVTWAPPSKNEEPATHTQPSPSFLPKQILPSGQKPQRWQPQSWQPPNAPQSETEGAKVKPDSLWPDDALVHEVVIWSSRTTEDEQRRGGDSDHRKPLPWQQVGKKEHPVASEEAFTRSTGEPKLWQPTQPTSTAGNLIGQKSTSGGSNVSSRDLPKPAIWKPQEPAVTDQDGVKDEIEWKPFPRQPSANEFDQNTRPKAISEPSQHRWQPTQLSVDRLDGVDESVNRSTGQRGLLEEPQRRSQEGSVSPVVTSLFLTRVVTDGSGSDVEGTHDSLITGKKKLYADSSFYEDPEHKYPTIVEQIKMARKVALLLTSPANKNARGQRMFLKRKEQSSKWVIDISKYGFGPSLINSPSHTASDLDGMNTLNPVEVEEMRYHGEKSRHDVIPFDVCSMLAAELHEEKGRGGRMFAKRRDQADKNTAPETKGLIQVPDPVISHQEPSRKFVPESVPRTSTPVKPPQPRDQVDNRSEISLPVNRLKNMIDPPKPRMTPWDSAVQYGTVEPAFEHLRGYHPYGETAAEVPELVSLMPGSRFDQSGSSGTFKQGRASNPTLGYKLDEISLENNENVLGTPPYQRVPAAYQDAPSTGFVQFSGSSGFNRQAAGSDRKGYRPVSFQVGGRSFN